MNLLWLLIVLFVIFAVIGLPQAGVWNHSYGYYPSGIGVILFIVVLIILLRGGL